MTVSLIDRQALERALALRDLSDPQQGPHAMQLLLDQLHSTLISAWGCRRQLHRGSPLVPLADNYDHLGYPADGAARAARYTRYVTPELVLRTQTSAAIPAVLRSLALDPPDDLLLIVPGLVYRRDSIDRLHTDAPHQVDLWRLRQGRMTAADLGAMVQAVLKAVLPGHSYRLLPSSHPYTRNGMQIDVRRGQEWIEVGECGLVCPDLLARSGLDPQQISGLALGLGLDRLLMLRKGIDDIRLLRAHDPRVSEQMLDLAPYRPVSNQPAIERDLSLAVAATLDQDELGDRVREALGSRVEQLEQLEVLAQTPYAELPPAAVERMGILPGQKNVLLRLVIRDPVRSLTREEANRLRDAVYAALHAGHNHEWASAQPAEARA